MKEGKATKIETLKFHSTKFRNFRVFGGRLFIEHPRNRCNNYLHKICAYISNCNKMNYDPQNCDYSSNQINFEKTK